MQVVFTVLPFLFKLRESNGAKITKKKKVEGTSSTREAGEKARERTTDTNFDSIELEEEEENEVPVYDLCHGIR